MIAIDTNILARYIVRDDEKQTNLADKFFKKFEGKEKSIFINPFILCELVWVLKRCYKYKRPQIIEVLQFILEVREFSIGFNEIIWEVVELYSQTKNIDFSDLLISRMNKNLFGCRSTKTFDQAAFVEDDGFEELANHNT